MTTTHLVVSLLSGLYLLFCGCKTEVISGGLWGTIILKFIPGFLGVMLLFYAFSELHTRFFV